ncbi:hypothetical protein W822_16605 [Advenella kashmirensis W13003]|uniref:Uncharacterized protein n=1 Tax=Advenella kashmirensis W13003 TaxID=1424334 RepID=V8QSY8_9BURK|nr:hypothetical protein [Advenella kashmirensis]ETF02453.1 hypothetical protein W822_16605 [Advenella kashmirensis W13003]
MSAIIIAVVLLAGFLYSQLHIKTQYSLFRSTGWHTYFLAGMFGTGFALLAGLVTLPLAIFLPISHLALLAIWGGLTVLFAYMWGQRYLALYLFRPATTRLRRRTRQMMNAVGPLSRMKIKLRALRLRYETQSKQEAAILLARKNRFEFMLYQAAKSVQMVQFTLKSNKVYIGYIQNTSDHDHFEDTEYITIFPLISGYRNRDDQTLTFTTYYTEAYSRIDNENPEGATLAEEFITLIPRSEIATMAYFSPDYYGKFDTVDTPVSQDATDTVSWRTQP